MYNLQATNHELTEQLLGTFRLSRRVFVDLGEIDRSQVSSVWSNCWESIIVLALHFNYKNPILLK